MGPYRCVIFDMDGTLTATNRLIFDAFNHIVVREGKTAMTDEQIMSLFGPPEEGALEKIVGTDRVEEAMEEYLRYYDQHHQSLASLHDGIRPLLDCLVQDDRALAIFTGKGRHTTAITLRHLRLEHFFQCVVTGNDVEQHKPSGEGIGKVMRELGADPASTIMVGDSVSDIKAAREAGVAVASVLWDAHAPEKVLELHPDFVFHSVQDLKTWICA